MLLNGEEAFGPVTREVFMVFESGSSRGLSERRRQVQGEPFSCQPKKL